MRFGELLVLVVATIILFLNIVNITAAKVITNTTDVPLIATKPHLVFMLVDDWGWANVGYHRDPPTKEVVTPNIDSLVKEGLELDQHYAFKFC